MNDEILNEILDELKTQTALLQTILHGIEKIDNNSDSILTMANNRLHNIETTLESIESNTGQ